MRIYEIKADNVYIFYAYTDETNIEKMLPEVSEFRRGKVSVLRFDDDKKLSLLSEIILRHALDKLNIDYETPLSFTIASNGKPSVNSMRDWHYNISHCDNIVVCAISTYEIGVDVEHTMRKSNAFDKYFTEAEKELAKEYSASYIWTRKEAVAKANGRGIAIGLDRFDTTKQIVELDNITYRINTISIENYYISYALL